MKTAISLRHAVAGVVIAAGLCPAAAFAHGPVIVLSNNNGTIQTNQLDFTDLTYATTPSLVKYYPIGDQARVFPRQFNSNTTFDNAGTGLLAGKSPTNPYVVPMKFNVNTSANNPTSSGWYGELETADGFGTATLRTGPGLGFSLGGFASTTQFRPVFTDVAKRWNNLTQSFETTPNGERIRITSTNISNAFAYTYTTPSSGTPGNLSTDTESGNFTPGTGGLYTSAVGPNPGNHKQYAWSLVDSTGKSDTTSVTTPANISDGIYLATVQIQAYDTTTTQGFVLPEPSLPFFILFEKNALGADLSGQEAAAYNFAASTVPEPGSAGVLAIGSLGLLLRRRRQLSPRY